MQDVNIGATIARERREAGITQDELAAHLGVTKAAVSKWERGQSLPDVALLPRIAAYFRLTLDQLFDYRPQLSAEEVTDIYLDMLERFTDDAEAAYERLEGLVADHYSCWPLLLQAASLYLWRTAVEPQRTEELAAKALALLDRVEERGDGVDEVMGAKILHGSILSLLGDVDGAIELMESLRPKRMVPVDDLLAGLYEQKGDSESCLQVLQQSLFWGSTNAMGSIVSQLPHIDDADHVAALLRAGEGMAEGFDMVRTYPTAALMFWGNAASACVRVNDIDRAAAYLERFIDALGGFDVDAMAGAFPSVLYDRVTEAKAPDATSARMVRAQFGIFDFASQARERTLRGEAWESHCEDPRLKPLLDRLAVL